MRKIFFFSGIGFWIGFSLLQILISFNLKFTAWPEMLAYPYLLKNGYRLYTDIINPYPPLLPVILMELGQWWGTTVGMLRLVTLSVILISDLSFWWLSRKYFTRFVSFILVVIFSWLQWVFDANGLWFDLVVVPFAIWAFAYFYEFRKAQKIRNILAAALLLGLGFIVKQTTIWWVGLIFLYLMSQKKYQTGIFFLLVVSLPYFVLLLFFPVRPLIFWTLTYPFFIASRMPGYVLLPSFKQLGLLVILLLPTVWLLRKKETRFLSWWTLSGLGFGYPRFDFFHLQAMLPFLILGAGLVCTSLKKMRWLAVIYIIFILGLTIKFLSHNWQKPVRFFDRQTQVTARKLSQKIPVEETVFFYNTPAQYFVLADLLPSKPWADTFPWYLEVVGMQKTINKSLTAVNYVVISPSIPGDKYALGAYQPQEITAYVNQNFQLRDEVEVIQILMRK
ncbi:MAG: hypothetical protein UV61_C0002G0212 [Candidatus Gottesmanbacteria bacterium GW2011_GWB1_43_11]|uniref:Glycosyltransferase RgtA/B/C/D-like domain-containing protein n=1 Tax=Candidatus Gottesmanbacteria bacterium GW2011_GWB1_43_11 TaxID=1618446 RepID=A0A0G1EWV0_9BACT|nr:MAG: hypothetical protein UV04_C0001G0100 [Candidatus Gottesmanbacteria bacterium GW2011_GWA2_42_16]KKS56289.1 MAG: hypothetical protein UV17_C0001G0099 [Candidatus Gottesmanbacteria bacterium GW2011_GWA1_42_26]KKS82297.1 MAG: hypothetical protein UV55_C0003G0016 [Candidatus Gottesmanbacteria bacterium GW2011_GWC1_43_10]KKS87491.1 MAG: hypothetical protein UV61_C0002G0212 [Candidatus Gottesmanbacteria bacterium GW2011_GWB1_43_11]OGG10134.1 MAG: hypothetical protein A2699_01145 [Candidatus Go